LECAIGAGGAAKIKFSHLQFDSTMTGKARSSFDLF
jgi:hypothetical protein